MPPNELSLMLREIDLQYSQQMQYQVLLQLDSSTYPLNDDTHQDHLRSLNLVVAWH